MTARDQGEPAPERIAGYRIVRRLGEGAMGVVYLAEQESLGRAVALKVIRPERALSETAVARFRREGEALAGVDHPNVVRVFECGQHQGRLFLAMELVPGRGLEEWIAEASASGVPLPHDRVMAWGRDLAGALHAAHAAGVVHRDVKPSNVRITEDDRAVLLDFGLARSLEESAITRTGQFQGTPVYSSPEQVAAQHEAIGPATDVWSLGACLYEALTGRAPFAGASMEETFRKVLLEEPAPLRRLNTDVPRDLEIVVQKTMEKRASDRYASAGELADDLDALLEFLPIRARPTGLVRRAAKWCRRRPGTAAALATATLALLAVPVILLLQGWAQQRDLERRAGQLIAEADRRMRVHVTAAAEVVALEPRVAEDLEQMRRRYTTLVEDAARRDRAARLRRARRERDESYYEALQHLSGAERLLPGDDRIREKRAEVRLARWRTVDLEREPELADALRGLVELDDPEGRHAELLRGLGSVQIATDPPGAEVYLFRYREQAEVVPGGEARLVPVPVGGAPAIPPGTRSLRVLGVADGVELQEVEPEDVIFEVAGHPVEGLVLVSKGKGDTRRLDRIVAIDGRRPRDIADLLHFGAGTREDNPTVVIRFQRGDHTWEASATGVFELIGGAMDARGAVREGGVDVKIHHLGEVRSLSLPRGPAPTAGSRHSVVQTRDTAAPLLAAPECSPGTTPLEDLRLPAGSYLALLRKDGFRTQRVPFRIRRGVPTRLRAELVATDKELRGYVYVPMADMALGRRPFWIKDFEVDSVEYLEFLDDPETRRRIAESQEPILYPRHRRGGRVVSHWTRDADGSFELPRGPAAYWPVRGITWSDARAYAVWRTQRHAEETGDADLRFDLPEEWQWLAAAQGADGRAFVYGHRFHPHWTAGEYAREWYRSAPHAVLAFPLDESPYGAFDLNGNVAELSRTLVTEREGWNMVSTRGGAYPWSDDDDFRLTSRQRVVDDGIANFLGFRLVAWREKP